MGGNSGGDIRPFHLFTRCAVLCLPPQPPTPPTASARSGAPHAAATAATPATWTSPWGTLAWAWGWSWRTAPRPPPPPPGALPAWAGEGATARPRRRTGTGTRRRPGGHRRHTARWGGGRESEGRGERCGQGWAGREGRGAEELSLDSRGGEMVGVCMCLRVHREGQGPVGSWGGAGVGGVAGSGALGIGKGLEGKGCGWHAGEG